MSDDRGSEKDESCTADTVSSSADEIQDESETEGNASKVDGGTSSEIDENDGPPSKKKKGGHKIGLGEKQPIKPIQTLFHPLKLIQMGIPFKFCTVNYVRNGTQMESMVQKFGIRSHTDTQEKTRSNLI